MFFMLSPESRRFSGTRFSGLRRRSERAKIAISCGRGHKNHERKRKNVKNRSRRPLRPVFGRRERPTGHDARVLNSLRYAHTRRPRVRSIVLFAQTAPRSPRLQETEGRMVENQVPPQRHSQRAEALLRPDIRARHFGTG